MIYTNINIYIYMYINICIYIYIDITHPMWLTFHGSRHGKLNKWGKSFLDRAAERLCHGPVWIAGIFISYTHATRGFPSSTSHTKIGSTGPTTWSRNLRSIVICVQSYCPRVGEDDCTLMAMVRKLRLAVVGPVEAIFVREVDDGNPRVACV